MTAERSLAILFKPQMTAELDARAAFRIGAIQASTFNIIGAVLNVRAKLFLRVILDLRTMKKPGGKGTKVR